MAKIAIYTYFPAYIGGGERYIMTIASALQEDHDVLLLCPNTEDYQKLSVLLDIDLSKVNFVEFHNNIKYKRALYNSYFNQTVMDYDIFLAMTNHIYAPTIGLGRINILLIQFPYPLPREHKLNLKSRIQQIFNLASYKLAIVYSDFAKKYVCKKMNQPTEIIYPPVEIENFQLIPYENKKNQILSVGRFIGSEDSKCQLEMVRFFRKMHDLYPDLGINYLCIGGERPESIHQEYLRKVKQESQGYPIKILTNITVEKLVELYSESKIFWHAKGYNAGNKNPEHTEHFGISTVEAMASGCIPMAFRAGGQLEIIEDNKNGFLWRDEDELIQKTVEILNNHDKALLLSANAYNKSIQFSSKRFKSEIRNLVDKLMLCN